MKPEIGSRWRHQNGYIYTVVAIAMEDDLGVEFVILQADHDQRYWARTVANFRGTRNGLPRFTAIS